MSKYADYLKEQGATEEELKLLVTPLAERAYEKVLAERQTALEEREKTEQQMRNYEQRVQTWYTENDAKLKQTQNQTIAAQAEAARYKAAVASMKEQGLIDVAKDLGWDEKDLQQPKQVAAAEPDSRYVPREEFLQLADSVGDGLARLEDMVMEHKQLFPDQPLSVRQLRNEAKAAGKDVHQYWEERYKVPSARENAQKVQREAEIAKWKELGAKEKETELASKFGNPEMRPLTPSYSPFTKKPSDPLREKQPWQHADGKLAEDRVQRATKNLMEKQFRN